MPEIPIKLSFVNDKQRQFFENQKRNECFNGGYGNGKTYAGCMKIISLMAKFPGYRAVVGRWRYKELMNTTVKTFFKVCDPALYSGDYGGTWAPSRGYLRMINGSECLFMHFDEETETSIRSLEVNAVLLDQAEEISENIYLHLDSRVGRWDMATVPDDLLAINPNWKRNPITGKPIAPSYMFILCNPAEEGELHWIWQRYHPESLEHQEKFSNTHYYVEAASTENSALSEETLGVMQTRDKVWQDRFIYGRWGKGGGAIHNISPDSIIEVSKEWLDKLLRKSNLFRSFDHGGSTPAACLWHASCDGLYYVYREYYAAGRLISEHRKSIQELSKDEEYSLDFADPDIFRKQQQNRGGFWTVADEYADETITDSKPIFWTAADNNEHATRNRINELLRVHHEVPHPITGKPGSPKLFFIKRTDELPDACYHAIRETQGQKFQLLDTVNGKPIFSDARSESISDHAYDCLRYFCASHAHFPTAAPKKPPANSFLGQVRRLKALKLAGYFGNYGIGSPNS